MARSSQRRELTGERWLSRDRLGCWVPDRLGILILNVQGRIHRFNIRRQMKRRIRQALAANKTRIGPRKRAKRFRKLVPEDSVYPRYISVDIDVPVSPETGSLGENSTRFNTDTVQYEESDEPRVPRVMNPDPSELSEDGIPGVAVIAEFKPVGASCVDIQSATPTSTHPDVYFKDRPGSSLSGDNTFSAPQREFSFKRVFPKNWNTNSIASATTGSAHTAPGASQLVSIMCTPSSPPSSISSKQNVRPTTSYPAPTVVGHLEVPPRADTARDRQRSKPLAGGSGHNESTSRSKPRSAAPTVEERQDTRSSSHSSHSKGKHSQATNVFDVPRGIPRTETPSTISTVDKRLGTPSLSRSSHVKGKRLGRTTTMTDVSTQTERNPGSSIPIAVPTMANLMKRLPPSHFSHWNDKHDQGTTALASVPAHAEKTSRSKTRFPMSKHPEVPHPSHVSRLNRKRDHSTSTNSINDQNLENLAPLPLNIHKTGHDPLSYRARMESRGSSSSSNTEDEEPVRTEWSIECPPAPYSPGDHFSEHEDAPWLLPVDSDHSEGYIESSPYPEPQPCLISLWGYSEAQKAAHRPPTSDDPRDMYHPGYSSYSHYSQIQYGSSSTDWQSNPANIVPNSSVYPLHTENPSRNWLESILQLLLYLQRRTDTNSRPAARYPTEETVQNTEQDRRHLKAIHQRGYIPRKAEEATLPDANSIRAPWRIMPDASARNLSITRPQTPQEALRQRIARIATAAL